MAALFESESEDEDSPTYLTSDASKDDSKDYLKHLTSGMLKSKDENQFCDITIKVGEKIFHAHKVILASSCEYFHRMFSSGFREAAADVITLEGDSDTFENILNFIYTGDIAFAKLAAKQLKDTLRMSCYLQFQHAIECCKLYLRNLLKIHKVSLQTAYEISLVCDTHGEILSDLGKACLKFCRRKFGRLKFKAKFYEETSKECLEMCIDNISWIDWKTRKKIGEEDLLSVINKWLSFDLDSRKTYAGDLLKKLRLGLLTETTFIALRDQTRDIQECKEILDEVMKVKNTPLSELMGATLDYLNPSHFAPRATITTLIAFGHTKAYGKECNQYIRLPGTHWKQLLQVPPLPKPLQGHSSVSARGKLYVAGGFEHVEQWPYLEDRDDLKAEFRRFDATMDQWEVLSPMPCPRRNFALLNMENRLLFIAGRGYGNTVLLTVDCYDILTQQWSRIKPLHTRVFNPSAVFVGGRIYVYGVSVMSLVTYVLQMYIPPSVLDDTSSSSQGGTWQVVLQEHLVVPSYLSRKIELKPFITVQNDKCYRVAFVDKLGESPAIYQVNEFKLCKPDDVCVGPEETQEIADVESTSCLDPTDPYMRVFCIRRRVYVGYGTCAINTGISMDDHDAVRNLIKTRKNAQNVHSVQPGPKDVEISYCIYTFDELAKGSVAALMDPR